MTNMDRAPRYVMGIAASLEALWLALVIFLFDFKLPIGLGAVVGTWVMLIAALYAFLHDIPKVGLGLSWAAFIACGLLLAFGGGGVPHLLASLYRDAPNLIFLSAAHYEFKGTNHKRLTPLL